MMEKERNMFMAASMALVIFSFLLTGEARWQGMPTVIADGCSVDSLSLNQEETKPMPNGIPTYTVEMVNICVTGCSVSDVRVSCGSFSSARTINPAVFRRVADNYCIVNDGKPIPAGGSVSFQYANTMPYPLSVSSLVCDP